MEPLRERKVIRISHVKFTVIILLIGIALILFILNYMQQEFYGMKPSHLESTMIPSMPAVEDSAYFRDGGSTPSVSDTREFLKMSYSANLKTRDVPDAVKQVKGA